jgi:hypothetical protein
MHDLLPEAIELRCGQFAVDGGILRRRIFFESRPSLDGANRGQASLFDLVE